jgi:cytochrome c556
MKQFLPLTLTCLAAGLLLSCESRQTTSTTTTTTTETGDTAVVMRKETNVSRELDDFKSWVNEKASRTDSATKENWPKVREEFRQRAARLDSKADSLSAEARAEYQELKKEYQTWEDRQEKRTSQPLAPAKVTQWEKTLLAGKAPETINAPEMREMYLTFMGVVRAQQRRWTQDDWDYVDHVYGRLNDRQDQVASAIPSADRLKIKTLQAEYLALEASSDAKDLYQHVKK